VLGHGVHLVEVVRREVQVLPPVETQPLHGLDDGIDVFLLFLGRIGVVEAHVAGAAVGFREAEVQADALGVAVMQVAVGLRREARFDPSGPFAEAAIFVNDVADEIAGGGIGGRGGGSGHRVLP
jgi:hypothetical protein